MKNKITKIYIACYKGDFWQTKICVASIRKWYPNIPIYLIKDTLKGDFDTTVLENLFNVKTANFPFKKFGWGISKLEPYFETEKDRFLILDSDIIFLGKVIDYLEDFDQDFVISSDPIEDCNTDWFRRTYYDLNTIQEEIDETFQFPGHAFNTGQLVATSGIFKRSDFNKYIDWKEPPLVINEKAFACADQGILNYFFPKKENQNEMSLGKANFKVWGNSLEVKDFDLKMINTGEGYPKLIHWAGGHRDLRTMERKDLIEYYQKLYYSHFTLGEMQRVLFNTKLNNMNKLKLFNRKYKIKAQIKNIISNK